MNRLAGFGLALALASALTALVAALGYQAGVLSLRLSLQTLLRWGAYGGAAGAALSAVVLVVLLASRSRTRRAVVMAACGFLLGAAVIGVPGRLAYESRRLMYPSIHDITTDADDPPRFVDVLRLRAKAANTAEYGGPEIAAQQRRAYPDIQPVHLNMPPGEAFDRALAAVREMRWELVAADREGGRIEATATTFWFRFKDDVVVRLRPVEGGTRVDARSVSRVGRGDLGTNAKRIRAYVSRLRRI